MIRSYEIIEGNKLIISRINAKSDKSLSLLLIIFFFKYRFQYAQNN